jgi:predicted helicase
MTLTFYTGYREKYKENLKIELPCIPFIDVKVNGKMEPVEVFFALSNPGRELAEIHLNYEDVEEYDELDIKTKQPIDTDIVKMKWNREKTELKYNDRITLSGFPKEMFNYKIGNRCPVEWVAEYYRGEKDLETGEVIPYSNDDDEWYVVKLIKKLVTVSMESLRLIGEIKEFKI